MPYLFTCPHCQTQTEVEDRYSGQAGRCVSCGGEIQLPEFAATSPSAAGQRTSGYRWIIPSVVVLILVGCLVFAVLRMGGQTMSRLAVSRERTSSIKNLEKIAAALNAYAADHGSYPPPFTTDDQNQRLHSWRVLILPYLGQEDLYNRFDLDVAWDDPENLTLMSDIPVVYQHPQGASRGLFTETAYYLIVGPGTLFPSSGPLGPDDVVDDPAQTILVIEGVPLVPSGSWTEPIDLDYVKMSGQIGSNPGIDPGGVLDGGAAMATVDGRGHFLRDSLDSNLFQALVTPAGGERMPDDTLD